MKLSKYERANWKRYSRKKGDSLPTCKVNRINIHMSNGFEHELAKFKIYYRLRDQGEKIITECWERSTSLRRDLVSLTTGTIVEIEKSTSKRAHRHPLMVEVFWYDKDRYRTLKEAQSDIKEVSPDTWQE